MRPAFWSQPAFTRHVIAHTGVSRISGCDGSPSLAFRRLKPIGSNSNARGVGEIARLGLWPDMRAAIFGRAKVRSCTTHFHSPCGCRRSDAGRRCSQARNWKLPVLDSDPSSDILHPASSSLSGCRPWLVSAAAEYRQGRILGIAEVHTAPGAAVEERASCGGRWPDVCAGGAESETLVSTPG